MFLFTPFIQINLDFSCLFILRGFAVVGFFFYISFVLRLLEYFMWSVAFLEL